jgi:formate hydrogenlyase subunit 3/multisubunit Na+/H+ antiporter MnhD subunit
MGFICAIIGMGMLAGDGRAALAAAFYAAHHVLVKGALFLSVGVIAATGSRRLWPMLLPAAIIAVGLGGLPLTGGALAKFVADELLGDSTASAIATLSAVGTTLLMLQFLRRLARSASQDPRATAAAGLVWPWLATAAVSLVVPWTLYLTVPRGTLPDPLSPAVLWKALWPVLLGAVLAIALERWWRSLPRIPKGDIIVALDGGMRIAATLGKALGRMDRVLRLWPMAGVSLLLVTVVLGAAVLMR